MKGRLAGAASTVSVLTAAVFLVSAGSTTRPNAATQIALQANAAKTAAAADPINPVVTNCNTTQPNAPMAPALLTSGLPCDVQATGNDLPSLQQNFDFYSWLTFLALNSPAGGTIASGNGVAGDAPAAWEQWKSLSDIMRADGSRPSPWGKHDPPPAMCHAQRGESSVRVLSMIAKLPDVLSVTNQPFADGPLIDQSGRYARYELLANRPMFEYIVANTLYNKEGQAAFKPPISFGSGKNQSGTTGTVGAIMVKAAWKIAAPGDDARFHTETVWVYTPPVTSPTKVKESCKQQKVALVGLHIVHKTANAPQWIWSTFEHVDNAPQLDDVTAKPPRLHSRYNFFDAACTGARCAKTINAKPPRPWDPNVQPFRHHFSSQIARVIGVTNEVAAMNSGFQKLLGSSVWSHYMLLSTQWPTDPTSTRDPNGAPAPSYLANTTMETYIQGKTPESSSSCIKCHGVAVDTAAHKSDFTYILERAKSKKAGSGT